MCGYFAINKLVTICVDDNVTKKDF